MRVNLALGSVSTALLIAWGAAASPPSKVTPSRLAERGDLIVVGEVVAVDAPTELDLQLPHMDRPAPALYRRYHVSVGQLVKTTGASPGGTIGVLAKSHGTLPDGRDVEPPPGFHYPRLRRGVTYLFVLRSLPGTSDYFLASHPQFHERATEINVRAVERAVR